MHNLLEIIRDECLPQRNCMLTIYNVEGDSAFLYFKDAQLIEVNTGKCWGKEALQVIATWVIVSFDRSELPLGIKRTLWESLDNLFTEVLGAEGAAGLAEYVRSLPVSPYEEALQEPALLLPNDPLAPVIAALKEIEGFKAVYREDRNEVRLVGGESVYQALSTEWSSSLGRRSRMLGGGLGRGGAGGMVFGAGRPADLAGGGGAGRKTHLLILSTAEVHAEEFEEAFRQVLG
ncbi:MAG: hypothetical protein HC901_03655 [Bdellovibrionaceae bacterium]|nr:hypothetical protein [Pseudobdellovibrionaceae bacterium]